MCNGPWEKPTKVRKERRDRFGKLPKLEPNLCIYIYKHTVHIHYSAKGPWKKSLNCFPTKYVIPQSLKVCHWLSQFMISHRWDKRLETDNGCFLKILNAVSSSGTGFILFIGSQLVGSPFSLSNHHVGPPELNDCQLCHVSLSSETVEQSSKPGSGNPVYWVYWLILNYSPCTQVGSLNWAYPCSATVESNNPDNPLHPEKLKIDIKNHDLEKYRTPPKMNMSPGKGSF